MFPRTYASLLSYISKRTRIGVDEMFECSGEEEKFASPRPTLI